MVLNKLKKNSEILELDLSNTLNEHNNSNRTILRLSEQIMDLEKDLGKEVQAGSYDRAEFRFIWI